MEQQRKQPTWSVRWRHKTRLTKRVVSTPMDKTSNAMQNRGYSANTLERVHTNSFDANEELIQFRPHLWNTIASRKRQFVM